MRELFSLGARLQKCADFVRRGSKLADIGTDHGYLPIWLLKSGKLSKAIAGDINQGPLNTARLNAEKYSVELTTVLGGGFSCIRPEDVEDAVIAGMGGELIAQIVSEAPWLLLENRRLILQPMTAADKLRKALYAMGFCLIKEELVKEGGKLYSVMLATQGVDKRQDIYMGAVLPGGEYSADYAAFVVKGLKNRAKGLRGEELEKLESAMQEIGKRFIIPEKGSIHHLQR